MTLKEQISADLISAMKNKETLKLNSLRVIKSEITKKENSEQGIKEFTDGDIIKLIQGSIANLKLIGNQESLDEISFLSTYVPEQMNIPEIEVAIKNIISEKGFTSKKEMGLVMKEFSGKYSGLADGKTVSQVVTSILV